MFFCTQIRKRNETSTELKFVSILKFLIALSLQPDVFNQYIFQTLSFESKGLR